MSAQIEGLPLTRVERRYSVVIDHETGRVTVRQRAERVRLSKAGARLDSTPEPTITLDGLTLTDLAALSEEITGALVYMTRAAVAVKADPDVVVR
jgi:hypothetical protein